MKLPDDHDGTGPLWICLNCGLAQGETCEQCGSRSVQRWVRVEDENSPLSPDADQPRDVTQG